jgi:hypothetical protein
VEVFVQVAGRQPPCTPRAVSRDHQVPDPIDSTVSNAASATSLHQKIPGVITSAAVAALLATSSPSLAALPAGEAETPVIEAARAGVDAAKYADAAAKGAVEEVAKGMPSAKGTGADVLDGAVKAFQAAAEKVAPQTVEVQDAVRTAAEKLAPLNDVEGAVGAVGEKLAPVKEMKDAVGTAGEKLAPLNDVQGAVGAVGEKLAPAKEVKDAVGTAAEKLAPLAQEMQDAVKADKGSPVVNVGVTNQTSGTFLLLLSALHRIYVIQLHCDILDS